MRSENEFLRAVEQQVREHPQAPAHKAPNGLTTTYAELWEASDRIAAALAARTEKRQPAVALVGELPLTCNGKVDRKALAEA